MKAVLMFSPGDPGVLQIKDINKPRLASNKDLLVKLKAAGVNPVDAKLRARGTYYPERLPAILGCDGAGVIEQIGSEVSRFKIGDEVYFCYGGIGGHPGNYAQYTTVNENFVAHKPKSIDFIHAAAAPLVLITAWESLFDRATLHEGDNVLIHAGAGGVGHVAIQLARLYATKVATTVSSADKARLVEGLGADHLVYYKNRDFTQEILNWTNGKGLDYALDTIGGVTLNKTFAAMKTYGDVVSLLQPSSDCDWATARNKNLRISLELMLTPMFKGITSALQHQANILQRCAEHIDAGKLILHVSETYPLSQVTKAHQRLMQGGVTGKLVLEIPD